MHNNYQGIALSLLFLLLFSTATFAQKGIIQGTVTEGESSDAVIGANVIIEGTVLGSPTDINGFYSIRNLESGTYNILISYIGFEEKRIEGVVVKDGEITKLDIVLKEDVEQLEEVVVFGQKITRDDIAVINEIKLKDVVVSGISGDQISRSMDRNAAQAARRISGVSIQDGRYVIVRGIAPRYNTTQINGMSAPSLDVDTRSFSFDVVPGSALDRLLVYKSASPDLPADFAGGLIQVYTKENLDENEIYMKYGAGFRIGTTFQEFQEQPRGDLFWTGYDNGLYSLPKGFPTENLNMAPENERLLYGQTFNVDTWIPETRTAPIDNRFTIQGNFKIPMGEKYLNSLSMVSYSNQYQFIEDITRQYHNGIDNPAEDTTAQSGKLFDFRFVDNIYRHRVRITALQNFSFSINADHKISFKNMYTHVGENRFLERFGKDDTQPGSNPETETLNERQLSALFRTVYTGQLIGSHEFLDDGDLKIDWIGGYAYSFQDRPDERRYSGNFNDDTGEFSNNFQSTGGVPDQRTHSRIFTENKENIFHGSFNLNYKFNINGWRPRIKTGVFYEHKDKDFDLRFLGFNINDPNGINQLRNLPFDSLFVANSFNRETRLLLTEVSSQLQANWSYDGTFDILAAYASLEIPIGKKILLNGGVRMEDAVQEVNGFSIRDAIPANSKIDETDFFPSVNLRYSPNEKWQFRLGYFENVNRPEFREIAPFQFLDLETGFIVAGDTNLVNAYIQNADARIEFYPQIGELISIGGFYKKFDDPIEPSFQSESGGGVVIIPSNANEATNYGIEVEFRKSFANVFPNTKVLNKMTLLLNGAWINSEVVLDSTALNQVQVRPMAGQSEWMVNSGLYYDNPDIGFNLSIFYNVIGPRLSVISVEEKPNVYEMPRHLLDISFRKNLGEHWELSGGVQNLLDAPIRFTADGDGNGTPNKDSDVEITPAPPSNIFVGRGDYPFFEGTVGQYITLAIKYTF